MRHPTAAFRFVLIAAVAALAAPSVVALASVPPGTAAGHPAVFASAWAAVLFWSLAAAVFLVDRAEAGGGVGRDVWSAGCGLFWLHAAVAMHAAHGWSHAAAFDHVERVGGAGAGVFVNYLFGAVWAADAAWMWLSPAGYRRRPRWLGRTVHGFLAFVTFNAAVVFAAGPPRWAALAVFAGLGWLTLRDASAKRR